MIITTTPHVEGYEVEEYMGIVFGEVISGMDFIRDIGAGLRDIFGGRSKGYEEGLLESRTEALQELEQRAREMGADAVIGCKMDYEVLGSTGGMLMVAVSGTAVRLRQKA